tara:strand:- start:1782 stop:2054 length:273 start_codon:yes stop_codon:yes gene_type:complete
MDEENLSKEQRDFIVEKKRVQLMNYIQEYKYLVIDMEEKTKLYKSLRDIEKELKISYSGISKKLKLSNYCICVEKKTTNVYYIQNINSEV